MQTKITENKDGSVTIEGELSADILAAEKEAAIKHLGKNVELPGFRKGHASLDVLEKHLHAETLLREMASRAMSKALPDIFAHHEIVPLGRPDIAITKLAHGNPLGYKLTTTPLPSLTLPDYKKRAQEVPEEKEIAVTDKEVEDTILDIRKRVAHAEAHKDGSAHEEGHEHTLPDLTDEFVAKLGPYKNTADFTEALKAEMKVRKFQAAKEKRRMAILEAILTETSVHIPDLLIESELSKMLAQFEHDVKQVGMGFDDYLTQIKKTRDDLKKEWRTDAEKRAKSQLVLNEIARAEHIAPDSAHVEKEVANILAQSPNANKDSVRIYVETMLTNELTFQKLETAGNQSTA